MQRCRYLREKSSFVLVLFLQFYKKKICTLRKIIKRFKIPRNKTTPLKHQRLLILWNSSDVYFSVVIPLFYWNYYEIIFLELIHTRNVTFWWGRWSSTDFFVILTRSQSLFILKSHAIILRSKIGQIIKFQVDFEID